MNPLAPALPAVPSPGWPGFQDSVAQPLSIPTAALASGVNYLFNRRWLVTIASLAPRAYNSLRTTFEIERTTFSAANKGKISVYNMGDLSRSLIMPQGVTRVILQVGYGMADVAPLFPIYDGYIWTITNTRHGPDIITEFELTEAGPQIGSTVVNLPFPAGTTNTTVIATLIGLMPGIVPGPQIGLQPYVYARGFTLTGSVKDNLDQLLGQQGLLWHVLGGVLYIHPKGISPVGAPALVSVQTGLIGTPNLTMPQGGAQTISFECLINPKVFPGAQVMLTSRLITVPLVLKTVRYSGDTHGSRWTQSCEGTPVDLTGELAGPPGP